MYNSFFFGCFEEDTPVGNSYEINRCSFLDQYKKINDLENKVNIIHLSDVHIGSEDAEDNISQAIMLSLEDSMFLSAIVCTGDLSTGYDSKIYKRNVLNQLILAKSMFMNANLPTLVQLGNHDANDNDGIPEAATCKVEQWETIFSDINKKWNTIEWGDKEKFKHYHFYDIKHVGGTIRVIVLDQLDHNYPVDNHGKLIYRCQEDAVYSQKQIEWLCNVALNTPPNTGILICNHFPFMARGSKEVSFLIDGQFVQGWNMIPEIVKAWVNKEQLSQTFTDSKSMQEIRVNADFRNYNDNCEFISYLVGHVHHKDYGRVQGYDQCYIMETTLGQGQGIFSQILRAKGTETSSAFSVLSIDTEKKLIYRTSYGAYINRNIKNNSRLEVINYTN